MSVIITQQKTPRGWRQFWPIILLLLALIIGAGVVWLHWSQILLQTIFWQRNLHAEMTTLMQQVVAHPHQVGLTLLGFSLIYGVLHALGPGHGKVVIATFLATHPLKLKTSLQLTLAAALLQGAVAVVLVTVMLTVLQLSSRQLHLGSYWLEKGSYLLVIVLGAWLSWRAVRKMLQILKKPARTFHRLTPLTHQHSADCGCGHQHVPDSESVNKAVNIRTKIMVVLSMGLRPCSGALMMLLFAKVIGVYWWGILSAIVMAAGTALTVSAMALLVHISRSLALKLSRGSSQGWQKMGLACLSLTGGLLLVVMGIVLWLTAQPALSGGIRPLFMR